jgi:alpha-tubulin suppressor-like RCC1 family protein
VYKSDEDVEQSISLINIGGEAKKRVKFIACGGEHIFAITRNNETYSWGRNEKGQLGIGYISTYISEP